MPPECEYTYVLINTSPTRRECRWAPISAWIERARTWSFRAGFSTLEANGPVGKLLDALGRHPYRPAHLHFILEADGFKTLVTHIFDPDDRYINSDAVFGVKRALLADFRMTDDSARAEALAFSNPFWE